MTVCQSTRQVNLLLSNHSCLSETVGLHLHTFVHNAISISFVMILATFYDVNTSTNKTVTYRQCVGFDCEQLNPG